MRSHKLAPSGKAGTLNTYVVMKSRIKKVDDSGNSAPIPSKKAKKRLDKYKAGIGPDDNSKELNGKVLYNMEGGLRHGRTPIGHGAVDKQEVLAPAKSKPVQASIIDAYQSALEENAELRETNGILIEENGVNRELILRFYADFGKAPPTDLLDRLANIDARRHQGAGSSQCGSHPQDRHNTRHASNDHNIEPNLDMPSHDGFNGICGGDGSGSEDMDGDEDNGDNQDLEE